MVEEINPAYYAEVVAGYFPFELHGSGFDAIPNDAIGLLSTDNDTPLMYIDVTSTTNLQEIVEKSSTRITTRSYAPHTFNNIYLGAIISADKSTVYWVNNTKPLP